MSDRQKIISRLIADRNYRADYIRAKLEVLIPSQLRALRLRQDKTQPELAQMADMKQSRISAMETPGKVNFNLDTLVRMAATHNTGLMVKFVPFSEMLNWENDYSQDVFNVTQLAHDIDFLQPAARTVRRRARRNRTSRRVSSSIRISPTSIVTSGVGAGTYMIPVQRERTQIKLPFEPSEQPPAQAQIAKVITLSGRGRSVLNDLLFRKTAAAAGAGVSYGNQ